MTAETPGSEDRSHETRSTADTAGVFGDTPAYTEPELGSWIGRYRLLELLGEGGMGRVYLAEQERPVRRRVALKLIRPGRDSHRMVARFNAERQALSLMQHPGLAVVFDADETADGQPFFVMEYVPGRPLTRFADDQCMTLSERLKLFVQVCDAVTHAHRRGVLHRDLTPANVLAFDQDGRAAVKVIDFGIASALTAASEKRPMTSGVLGTRTSMSPEQAAGRPDLDERTDVYGLGVLLYTLLAGVRPHDGGTDVGEAVLCSQRLREQPPETVAAVSACRRLSSTGLIRRLERELDWIPAQALRSDREDRYASVQALRDDIERYHLDLPLRSVPPRRGYRAAKFVSRHRRVLVTLAIVLLVASAGLGGTAWYAMHAKEQSTSAAASAAETERQTHLAQRGSYRSHLFSARDALDRGDAATARSELDACPVGLRHWEWGWLHAQAEGPARVLPHDGAVRDLGFSPDGSALLTASVDRQARVWDTTTGQERRTLQGHTHAVYAAAWSPDGRRVVTGSRDRTVRVWDVDTGAVQAVYRSLDQTVWSVAFADGGSRVVAIGNKSVCVWDTVTGEREQLIETSPMSWRAVTPDGASVLLGRASGGLQSVALGGFVRNWTTTERKVANARWVSYGDVHSVLVRWTDGTAELCAAESGATLHMLVGSESPVTACAWDPESGTAVTGHADGSVWRHAGSGAGQTVMAPDTAAVSALEWGPGGWLAVADTRGVIRLLEPGPGTATDAQPRVLSGHGAAVTALKFDPGGRCLASASADLTVRLWDLDAASADLNELTNAGRASLSYHVANAERTSGAPEAPLPTARFSGVSGSLLAQADDRGNIHLTRGLEGAPLELVGHEKPVAGLLFSPGGQTLLSYSNDRTVRLWSTSAAGPGQTHVRRAAVVFRHASRRGAREAVWSPDGQWIATGGGNGTVRLWESATGRLLSMCRGTGAAVTALAFDRGGHWLAVGHADGTAAVWDPRRTECLAMIARHADAVTGIAFSVDAARVATTGADQTLRIWDAADGEGLLTLRHDGPAAIPVFANLATDAEQPELHSTPRVVLAGGPRPSHPRTPQREHDATDSGITARWTPQHSTGSRGNAPSWTMHIQPGRRFDLLTPQGPGMPPPAPAAADVLDQLSQTADRVDDLLGLTSVGEPRPRLVAVPTNASYEGVVDLGRFGGIQSRRLIDSGWLSADPRVLSPGKPVAGLTNALIRNAFHLGPQHGEFRGGVVALLTVLCADDAPLGGRQPDLRPHLTALEDRFSRDTMPFLDAFTRRGTLLGGKHRFPDAPPSSLRMFYAAAMLRLHATCGGDDWVRRFFRLLATAPPVPGDTAEGVLGQATLWCAAASAAAGRDLAPEFVDRWRLPMNPDLRARFAATDWAAAAADFPTAWARIR